MKDGYLFRTKIDLKEDFEITSEDLADLDFVPHGDDCYHILSGKKGYLVKLKSVNYEDTLFVFEVNGREFPVKLQTSLEFMIEKMGMNTGLSKKQELIKAPMPGLVLDVKVSEGQIVKQGDPLLILEAMKMENIIFAAHDATIGPVYAKNGDSVEKAMVLLEFV